jgi:hypothetical protein
MPTKGGLSGTNFSFLRERVLYISICCVDIKKSFFDFSGKDKILLR